MKYLVFIFILVSCSSNKTAAPIYVGNADSSIQLMIDSTSMNIDSLADKVETVELKMARLEKEKESLLSQLNEPPPKLMALRTIVDSSTKIDYSSRIKDLEREVAFLKRRIANDSSYIARMNKTVSPLEVYVEKPNDKSLVVILNKKLRGDGDISDQGVSVWIMKYTKKAKKAFKGYDNCQQKDLNLLDAKEALYYKGQYFFNDIEPGEYLIKVCALYGNWMVVNKKDYKQEIEMLMSPPIQ